MLQVHWRLENATSDAFIVARKTET